MNKAEFRILDVLSRKIGSPISINELTKNIGQIHSKAHYAATYGKIKELNREGIVSLTKSGGSSLASLNFANNIIVDMLAEVELKRKQDFLKGKHGMQMHLLETSMRLRKIPLVSHVLLMHPSKNAKLNKTEMIVYLNESDDKEAIGGAKIEIHAVAKIMQKKHNVRIDYLTLEEKAFLEMIRSNEINTVREMLHDKIVISHPQDFWLVIKTAIDKGFMISAIQNETRPPNIPEEDLVYNLARFGYSEFGPTVKQGRPFCIEYVISAIMFHGDVRRIEAIPVIIAKNPQINYDLLLFLARKFEFGGNVLGILRTLRNQIVHGMKAVDEPIRLLEAMKIEEIKTDVKAIKEKLKLYNVT